MGEAKRRRQSGNPTEERAAVIEIRDPTEHPHIPGTVTVHVLHDSGASVTGSLLLGDVDKAVQRGEQVARELGGSRKNAREEARSYIANTLKNGSGDHLLTPTADTIILTAVWLAWTAPEPQRAQMREELRHDNKLVLAITEHSVYGRRAINGRLMMCTPEVELPEILQTLGMGPPTEVMTRKLAPH